MRKGVRQVFLVGILVSHSLLGLQKKNSEAGARVRNLGPGGIKEVQGQAEE